MRSRDRPVVSGAEQLLYADAEALEDFERRGQVWVHGERWNATTQVPVRKGQALKVTSLDGLTLQVEPVGD